MTILVRINKYLILVIILSKSKYCSDSNALVVGRMKDEMCAKNILHCSEQF